MGRRRINANADLLDRVANKLSRNATHMNTQKNALNRAADETEQAWVSQYTETFVQSVEVVERKLMDTSSTVSELARELHEIAEQIRELERELSH